ncbi:MAG: hypothetical protein ACO3Y3_08875 [Phycisphaerales bacterium]
MPAPCTRNLLEQAERDDPRGHALHIAAAMAWCFLQAIANTPEAIAWGLLAAISLLRLPRLWRCYAPALRDPVWLLFVAWWIWSLVTLAWAPPEVEIARQARPERALLTPLLLWPVAHRAWPLLAALAAGSAIQAISVLAYAMGPMLSGDPARTYVDVRGLMAFGQMGWYLQIAAVVPLAAIAATRGAGRWSMLPIPAIATIDILLSGLRSVLANLVVGVLVVALRPRRASRLAPSLLAAAVLAAAFASVWLAAPAAATRLVDGPLRAVALLLGPDGPLGADRALATPDESSREAVLSLASDRVGLLVASGNLIAESPRTVLLGHGKGAFPSLLDAWAEDAAGDDPSLREFATRVAFNNHPHNAYARAWVEGGLPQFALATLALWLLAARLWRRSRGDAALAAMLAIYAAVLVSSFVGIVEAKAPGAIIALAIALSRVAPERSDG